MEKLSADLIEKLKKAQRQEEVAELLKADGQDTALAERLWKELEALREKSGQKLSMDELKSVTGGADRDWPEDGCCATVEPGSWCKSNDWCKIWDVTYDHNPCGAKCPDCGSKETCWYASNYTIKCRNCGITYDFREFPNW